MRAERDLDGFRARTLTVLADLAVDLAQAGGVEAALNRITGTAFALLGDREAHLVPGALKPGERQFFIAGIFLVNPAEDGHILVAEHGFPAEQHRLVIPIDLGHPGWVWREQTPLLLANTDEHGEFRQILKTARMGSALYAPIFARGRMVGQLIAAAQARDTMGEADLEALKVLAGLAGLAYAAGGGDAWLRALAEAA